MSYKVFMERGPDPEEVKVSRAGDELPPLPEEDRQADLERWRRSQKTAEEQQRRNQKVALNRALIEMGLKPRG